MPSSRPLAHRAPRWLLAALFPLTLLPLQCTPKGGDPHVAPAGSSSAPAGSAAPGAPTAEGDEPPEGEDGPPGGLHDELPTGKDAQDAPAKRPPRVGLSGGLEAIDASDYATAEAELTKASKNASERGAALAGLARVMLETGRLAEAIKLADEASRAGKASKIAAAPTKARALAAQGKLEEAVKACEAVKDEPDARRARLVLGEILLRMGKPGDAETALMTLVDDFNQKRITTRDGEGMMLVGRATHLLRVRRDANEAYDDAERAGLKSAELFLYRAELFSEAYNLGRAEEMVRSALKVAPDLAAAHIARAQIKLAQTLDFDEAEREVQKALAVNKALTAAHFIRAGISLRDMELEQADRHVAEGLAIDPRDLDLLSMKAAGRFLADDKAGFSAATKAVLDLNPGYARMYHVIAEFADWEHRYAEIAAMMKEAIKLDPQDGKSYVNLGLNQIRLGQEKEGIASLDQGFRKDKFNVRAFNTLNLYERDIPQKYESVDGAVFHVRYPKDEKKVLERYMPGFLDDAWKDMSKRYGFSPRVPVGIELYGSRENFSVRTSGLPNIGIQGVCFGETLAAISPKAEPFNWGMVVWHEVGHVFAIQLSKNHVPRWFTEGLSEYETIARRPEWRREEDPALYVALKRGKVPTVEQMNRAFTHADDARDITTAYYASSQIVVFLVEKYGMPRLVAMLKAWGDGKRTPEVIRAALGVAPDELDQQFRTWLGKRLERYTKQYVPDLRPRPLAAAVAAAKASPASAQAQVDLALSLLAKGGGDEAMAALDEARKLDAKNPDAHFIRARMMLRSHKPAEAKKELEAMVAEGNDGYSVRILLADVAAGDKDLARAAQQFEAAAALDPTQAEPVQALVDMARKAKDEERELKFLRLLAPIDQHDRRVWRRLLQKLVAKGELAEARKIGEAALYVDIHGGETHALYAEALLGTNATDKAIFEADSALLCGDLKAGSASRANLVLARAYLKKGDRARAKAARDEALRQDPTSKEAEGLAIP
jgi:cellulose synthase operon protein C